MPEYLAPGIYIEELSSTARTIDGVSTSTAGFIGETERGPVRPTLVRGWAEYARRYGGFIDGPPFDRSCGFLPYAVRGFFENGGGRLVVARVTGATAKAAGLTLSGEHGSLELRAVGPGTWGNQLRIAVMPATNSGFRLQVGLDAAGTTEPAEEYDNLSTDASAADAAMGTVNRASELIEITACTGTPPFVDFSSGIFTGGIDSSATLDDHLGPGTTASGLAALSTLGGISVVAAPDHVGVPGLAEGVLDTCEALKDRFAVLSTTEAKANVSSLRPIRDTSWGATYYPWIRVPADHRREGTRLVPAVGHICGVYARVDATRGVHKAPANEPLNGIVLNGTGRDDGPLSHAVTLPEQDVLNPRGVNVIRDFRPSRGVLVWGGRTMSTDPEWKYVNVRRLFIYLERSIERGLRWAAFEPNTEPTWRDVRGCVEEFLLRTWRSGALAGSRAEEGFFVRCDRTTMTRDDIDNGRLVCEIGAAVIRPAEFVIFRIHLSAGGSS